MSTGSQTDVIKDTSDFLAYTDKMTPLLALLGSALGIDDFAKATVDGPGSLQTKCLAILRHWLNVTPNPTWKLFCGKLEKNDALKNLRAKIAQDHGVSGQTLGILELPWGLSQEVATNVNSWVVENANCTRMAKKEVTVRSVIQSLRSYLYDELTINEELLVKCEGDLIQKGTVSQLRALLDKGKHSEAVTECLHYIESFHNLETLGKFVDLLQKLSQKYPAYADIVSRFNDAMGRNTSGKERTLAKDEEPQPVAFSEVDGPPPRQSYKHVKAKDVLGSLKWRDLSKDIKDMLKKPRLKIMERDYKLIDTACNLSIKAYLDQENPDEAATTLIDYFEENHDGDALLRFCEFMRDEAKEAGGVAGLENLADKIERAVKAKGSSVDGPPPRESYRHVKAKDVLEAFKWRELLKDIKDMPTVLRLKIMERDYKLINYACNLSIKAALKQGDPVDAATKLIDYFEKNHDGDALLRFCEFLRDESKEAGGVAELENLADKIERAVRAKGSSGTP